MKTHTFPFLFLFPTSGVSGCGQPGREWQGDGGNEGRPGRRLGEVEARQWMAVVGGMGKTSSKNTSFIKGANAGPVQGKLNPMRVRCLLTKKRKEKRVVPWTCRQKTCTAKVRPLTKPGGIFLRDMNPYPANSSQKGVGCDDHEARETAGIPQGGPQ